MVDGALVRTDGDETTKADDGMEVTVDPDSVMSGEVDGVV
jgi:hypothetical protein